MGKEGSWRRGTGEGGERERERGKNARQWTETDNENVTHYFIMVDEPAHISWMLSC